MVARRKKTLNLREETVRQMTFVEKTVGTVAAAFVGNGQAVEFGEDDHAQVRTGEADLLSSLQPVDPRHAEIEKDEVRLAGGYELHSVQAVTSGPYDLKPSGEFQIVANRAERCRGIVGNQNTN